MIGQLIGAAFRVELNLTNFGGIATEFVKINKIKHSKPQFPVSPSHNLIFYYLGGFRCLTTHQNRILPTLEEFLQNL